MKDAVKSIVREIEQCLIAQNLERKYGLQEKDERRYAPPILRRTRSNGDMSKTIQPALLDVYSTIKKLIEPTHAAATTENQKLGPFNIGDVTPMNENIAINHIVKIVMEKG